MKTSSISDNSQEFDFKKLCSLARLNIPNSEQAKLISDLKAILRLTKKVQDLDLKGIEPLYHPQDISQVLRPDVAEATPTDQFRDKLLTISPQSDENYFVVPKVIE